MEKTKELVEMKERMAKLSLRKHADALVEEAVLLMAEIRRFLILVEIYISSDNMAYPNYRSRFPSLHKQAGKIFNLQKHKKELRSISLT